MPRSPPQWTRREVLQFQLTPQDSKSMEFFGVQSLPELDDMEPGILENSFAQDAKEAGNVSAYRFLKLLARASAGQEGDVNDLMRHILENVIVVFSEDGDTCETQMMFPFRMYRMGKIAKADIVIRYRFMAVNMLVLVRENKQSHTAALPLEQLVAMAIGIFNHNNTTIKKVRNIFGIDNCSIIQG